MGRVCPRNDNILPIGQGRNVWVVLVSLTRFDNWVQSPVFGSFRPGYFEIVHIYTDESSAHTKRVIVNYSHGHLFPSNDIMVVCK